MDGLICMGMNPAVGGPNSLKEREALGKLKWLVTVDLWETETSIFWKRPGVNPKEIQTEVFMLPAAASVEKEGSIVELRPLDPVALQGGGTAGRGQERPLDRRSVSQAGQRPL